MTSIEAAAPGAGGPVRSDVGTVYLDAEGQVRVRPGSVTAADVGTLAGAAVGALGLEIGRAHV